MFISYHRKAYTGADDKGLRLTIDSNISYRLDMLYFTAPQAACLPIKPDTFLLEIKTPAGIPMWLTRILSEIEIFSESFSKYAACFSDHMLNSNEKQVVRSA